MISRQQEDEEKVSTSMSSIGETLETILAKFEFYATEHKKMNTTLKESVNAQKDLVAKVDLYRQENEKLRQELALKEFNRQNRPDSDQAGYIGMRDPKHAHNLENGFPFDRNFPGQHELAKQLKKNEKDKKKSGKPGKPVGLSNKDMRSSSNYGVTKDYGLGADLGAGVGARGDQQRSNHQNGGQPEDSEGFKLPKGGRRNKARGNTSQETEAERRTNGEKIAAKELIIHNIESQDPLNYSREKEAELVQEVFEELGVKHLKQFGVDVNLETDIWSHIRLTGHWEAKPENKEGPNGRGCAPIKVRLMSEKICSMVLKAASKGGCLIERKPVFIGKYRGQRLKDRAGHDIDQDPELTAKAAQRPKWTIRPSITTQRRAELREAKLKRDAEKNDPKNSHWKERNEEIKNTIVIYNKGRNFDNCGADEGNRKMLEDAKARKDEADAAIKRREEEKQARIAEKARLNGLALASAEDLGDSLSK